MRCATRRRRSLRASRRRRLNGGPADISISISLGGSPATLDMLAAKLQANITAARRSRRPPRAHSRPPRLGAPDPTLTSFETMGSNGKLCGNVNGSRCKNVPVPMALQGCGLFNCSKCYDADNSLLDVIVGGCSVLGSRRSKRRNPTRRGWRATSTRSRPTRRDM